MRKIWIFGMMVLLLFLATGCSAKEMQRMEPALGIEAQLSEAHQKFERKKQKGEAIYMVVGALVIAGVAFKGAVIVSGCIGGYKLGQREQLRREQKIKRACEEEMTDYQRERQWHKEYMEERKKRTRQ